MSTAEMEVESMNPVQQYSQTTLKTIGEQCRSRLPPAPAVQAMFLYEMQRQTEVERLFNGAMFDVAQSGGQNKAQEARMLKLEAQVKSLQEQITAEVSHGREQRLMDIEESLKALQTTSVATINLANDISEKVTSHHDDLDQHAATVKEMNGDLNTATNDLDILFDERDALVALLNQTKERIDKLEDLVRALTLQSPPLSNSPALVQRLPVQTSDGRTVDLAVPKGRSVTPLGREQQAREKDNQAPIRPFKPGEQWMATSAEETPRVH